MVKLTESEKEEALKQTEKAVEQAFGIGRLKRLFPTEQHVWCFIAIQALRRNDEQGFRGFVTEDLRLTERLVPAVAEALRRKWKEKADPFAYLKKAAREIRKCNETVSSLLNGDRIVPIDDLSEPINEDDLQSVELLIDLEKACNKTGLSKNATRLVLARFVLGVTREDAHVHLSLAQKEVERAWREMARKAPFLKKNLS